MLDSIVANEYIKVMDMVVEIFTDAGWDCKWAQHSDSRGPHDCFYVHNKHWRK